MTPTPILVYGIGAQKAATTWLFEQLEKAPCVHVPRPKELHYWDSIRAPYLKEQNIANRFRIPQETDSLRYRLSPIWKRELRARIIKANAYRTIFHERPEDHSPYLNYLGLGLPGLDLVADITPSYALLRRDTFAEMLNSHSDVRFVFLMREPVTRFWSGIKQRFRGSIRAGGLSDEGLERMALRALRNQHDPDMLRSNYLSTITELEAAVPVERIHYGFFETLLNPNQGAVARSELANFMGLSNEMLNPDDKVHAGAHNGQMPEQIRAIAKDVLRPVHEGIIKRFGAAVPDTWGRYGA